jgi:hypothetical protein
MQYESIVEVISSAHPGVTFRVRKLSFGRRLELLTRVGDLARKAQWLQSGGETVDKIQAAELDALIDRVYVEWGLDSIADLYIDETPATPLDLLERGPEELCREALAAIREQLGLSEQERKNSSSPSTSA